MAHLHYAMFNAA